MKKIFFYILGLILTLKTTYADGGILGDEGKAKSGNFHIDDIPVIIKGIIDFGIGIAGTVSIVFIIFGAYQILFGGLVSDKSKGRSTIVAAIIGFVIALLAWFIIKLLIDNLQK